MDDPVVGGVSGSIKKTLPEMLLELWVVYEREKHIPSTSKFYNFPGHTRRTLVTATKAIQFKSIDAI